MTPLPIIPARDAVVLAAGNGDRFHNRTIPSKLLQPLAGRPLILRTIETAAAAGITAFEVVVGYQAEAVRAAIERHVPAGTTVHFIYNPEWRLENGISALKARARMGDRRFALLMGDHLFDAIVLRKLCAFAVGPGESVLAVDRRPAPPQVAAEATRVRLDGDRITGIGKGLDPYDALDTGVFVCAPPLFDALEVAIASGDTTLSGGIRRLAARGLMRAADIGGAAWQDVDTLDDLDAAEALLGAVPESA